MTPTEKARRAEALYYDNNNITRRTLCHMIVNLEADMKDTEARNAQLRERITTQKQTIQAYRDESREWREVADHAQAENDRLRKACAELLKVAEHYDPEWLHWPEMHDEFRKLGVEVK